MKLSKNDSNENAMNNSLEAKLRAFPRPYATDIELDLLLDATPDSRYGKVKRMLAQRKLLHIRRGLYCLTEGLGYSKKPHPFELAQHIYSPSYISLESALSFHQLIPEGVYTVTSVTNKRAKEFKTPLGHFSYQHLRSENFYTSVELVNQNEYQFLIAKPWKAICDYLFCYKKNWINLTPLIDSLRLNLENLPLLSYEEHQQLDEYYCAARISRFLRGIK